MNQKLKIGVVGLHFGKYMLTRQLLSGPGVEWFEVAGICDLNAAIAAELGAKHNLRIFESLDAMLAERDIAAIALFTGPVNRAKLISKIVRAGKDVMTTKPLEVDPDAAEQAIDEARRLGRVLHLNSPGPLLPADLRQIRQWIDEYDLGRPIAARFETWCAYNEKPDGSWYDDREKCPAAPIFRLGIYGINDIVQFFGEAQSVQLAHSRISTGRPTPDNAVMTIRFKSGALGTVFASFCVNDGVAYPNRLSFNFQRGTIDRHVMSMNDGSDGRIADLRLHARKDGKPIEVGASIRDGQSGEYQWENFYRAARGEKLAEEVTPEQICGAIRIIRAMSRAEGSGQTEAV